MSTDLVINDGLAIPTADLDFAYARSSGPGGQNVNKVETKVILYFDVAGSPHLSDAQKEMVRERLATRISKHGVLRVVSQRHRTRQANQRTATERFVELLREALTEAEERKPTRSPRAARARRLEDKRRRGRVKQLRSRPEPTE
jgi:ribosome-associated protein